MTTLTDISVAFAHAWQAIRYQEMAERLALTKGGEVGYIPRWAFWPIRRTGENRRSIYYRVNEVIVIHTPSVKEPVFCAGCRENDCDHAKRLKDYLDAQPHEGSTEDSHG